MANPQRSPEITLPRGKACLSCRRRKMRCDGARPVCTQCIRGNREDDCEYTDNQGRTRTQMLEENVARLQARLHELENPNASAGNAILLHDPYDAARNTNTNLNLNLGAYGALPAPGTGLGFGMDAAHTIGMVNSPVRPGSTPAVMSWWEFEEPPVEIANWLIQQLIPHAAQLHFALNISRFVDSLSLPTLHPARPHPALLHTIYLWALRLSKAEDLMQHEALYLQRAILALQDALSAGSTSLVQTNGFAAMRRIHAIQAEVLLAQYFYSLGRFLEGQYHANAAASLALSSGLHRINPRSSSSSSSRTSNISGADNNNDSSNSGVGGLFDLSPPRDAIELGERVNVFWAVFTIDRCWAAAINAPSLLSDAPSSTSRIDTPWPLDTDEYEVAHSTPDSPPPLAPSASTVRSFLAGQPGRREGQGQIQGQIQGQGQSQIQNQGQSQANENSNTALRAKASALFERATRLGAVFSAAGTDARARREAGAEMQALAQLITRFARTLRPLDDLGASRGGSRSDVMLVVHSLAHAAMIQIQHARAYAPALEGQGQGGQGRGSEPAVNMDAVNASLVHAGEVVRILEIMGDDQGSQLDPILGFVWMLAAQVFAEELRRVRRSTTAPTPALASRANALQVNLNRISTALEVLSANPVVAFQIAKINELLRN